MCTVIISHEVALLIFRISYIELLKPYAIKRQTWRHGNNMLSLLTHPAPELPIGVIVEPPQKGLYGITAKLRQKVGKISSRPTWGIASLRQTTDFYPRIHSSESVARITAIQTSLA
jgi:hypothetical protein